MKNITKMSEVSRSEKIIIDNYNESVGMKCICTKIQLIPFYRVYFSPVFGVGSYDEKYFLDEKEANKYFSELMRARGGLF